MTEEETAARIAELIKGMPALRKELMRAQKVRRALQPAYDKYNAERQAVLTKKGWVEALCFSPPQSFNLPSIKLDDAKRAIKKAEAELVSLRFPS